MLVAIVCLGSFIAIAVAVLVASDRIEAAMRRRRETPEKLEADRREIESRLKNPDWSFFETHLQRPAPKALRDWYSQKDKIHLGYIFEFGEHFEATRFQPLDSAAFEQTKEWMNLSVVPFADNLTGDPIYLRPGPKESNAVFVTYHDGGETEELCGDISTFIGALRLDERENGNAPA